MLNLHDQKWGPAISDRSIFTLYLGNRDGDNFSKDDRDLALTLVSKRFPSFSTFNGEGYYKGSRLPTLIFQIATKDRYSLSELCHELCEAFDQKWIGLSDGISYRSISRRMAVPNVEITRSAEVKN